MVTTVLNLVSFALVTLGIALFAAFGIMLISKLGLRDMIIADAPKLLSMLFECDFCLSWWTCLALSILVILFIRLVVIGLINKGYRGKLKATSRGGKQAWASQHW